FVGWGNEPYFSEYSRSGKLLYEAELPGPDLTYRATLQRWAGLPLWPPTGAARRHAGATTVYASWNGATQVTSWRVLAPGDGRRQRRDRGLAAARHARRLAGDADQLPRRPRHPRQRGARRRLAQRRARRRAARLLDGNRRKLPAQGAFRPRRARGGASAR